MKSMAGNLAAPFPYFGGKSNAVAPVWAAFGEVANYVEPFAGSAAMLLGAPAGKRVETINDFDGFVANFWRAIAADPDAVAHHADWPVNETDLFARHSWLVRQRQSLTEQLHACPEWCDPKIAGWWVWGACAWIGSGWCTGVGPWVHDGEKMVCLARGADNGKRGVWRQSADLSSGGVGVHRQLPYLSEGRGVNRSTQQPRRAYIKEWFGLLHARLRDARVACGDWARVCKDSVTTRHGLTAVFLDPPYAKGAMDYGAGGMGQGIAEAVRAWCAANGDNPTLRIVLCGHSAEHDALLLAGWHTRSWVARKGYAASDEAVANCAGETLWCSPHCVPERGTADLFALLETA
jgi:site-specific DNA-adenine methylase